jgi:serine/threonine protein kinase
MSVDINQAKAIFLAILERPAHEQATFLDAQCGADETLRRRVEAMLAAHATSGELLPRPADQLLASADAAGDNATSSFDRPAEPPHAAPDLGFLGPATKPGAIGRLGHYEVLAVLGQGGFGIVLKAFDDRLQRVVALKVLAPVLAANGSARKRFVREARTAAAVKNEHVVAIYDVEAEADQPYLAMEMIDGISLQDKLDRRGPLAVPEILRIGTQMAEGLAAAHKQGLVHRDIKPANVLLENGVERVKITDFGLARAVDDASVSQSGTVVGTPLYMAPEQAEGLAVDHRSDLFSLGSVLYAMCTGHSPFRASSTHAVLKRVIEDAPRPIGEINHEIPDWLSAIVARLHAKKPEDRFQSAREVADSLQEQLARWQRPDPEARRLARRVEPITVPVARPPSWWPWALLTLFGLLFGAAFWLGPPLVRHLANRANLELIPQPGLTSIIVLQNDATVTDWLDMRTSHTLALSPGKYQLNPGCEPGYEYEGMRWEVTTMGPWAGQTVYRAGPSCYVEVQRGERLTVRAMPRETPAHRLQEVVPHHPAAPTHPVTAGADKNGWVQLFSGKDFTGWKTLPGHPGDWKVEAGELVGRSLPGSWLFSTAGPYADFHLRAEVKLNATGNSGVFVRMPFKEFRFDDAPGYEADLSFVDCTPRSPIGSVWQNSQRVRKARPSTAAPDQWFTLEVFAHGPNLRVLVNGQAVAEYSDDEEEYEEGHIALQALDAGTVVRFRKIEIRELRSVP